MPPKALVIGGAGAMGRWCARLLKEAGMDVSISSRGDAADMARSLGVGLSRPQSAGAFDVVVLSVPIDAVEAAAAEAAPNMRPGALLMDLSSLKSTPVAAMLRHAPPGVEVLGAHPLFGPGAVRRGTVVALVPTDTGRRWLPVIAGILEAAGHGVLETTAERHDRAMAVVQGLTHFMYVALGRTFERAGVDLGEAAAFRTPVYSVTLEMLGRVLAQSPELYALIQSSDDAGAARRAFVDACRELAAGLDAGERDGFVRGFEAAARHYGDTAGARRRSERLVECEMDLLAAEAASGEKPGPGPREYREIAVRLPAGADPAVLRWALAKIDGVESAGICDAGPPYGGFAACRFTLGVPVGLGDAVMKRVRETVRGLGLEVE